jgi:hypothetical protein
MQNIKHTSLTVFLPGGSTPDFLLELISKIAQCLFNHVTVVTAMKMQG